MVAWSRVVVIETVCRKEQVRKTVRLVAKQLGDCVISCSDRKDQEKKLVRQKGINISVLNMLSVRCLLSAKLERKSRQLDT